MGVYPQPRDGDNVAVDELLLVGTNVLLYDLRRGGGR